MILVIALLILAGLLSLYFFLVLVGAVLAILSWLILGAIAGWAASAITHSSHGLLGDIGVGLAGSVIGGVLYLIVTGHSAGGPFSLSRLVAAIVGSIVLLAVVKAVNKEAV